MEREKNRISRSFGDAVRVDQILSQFRLNNAKAKIQTKTLGLGRALGEADKLLCLVRYKRLRSMLQNVEVERNGLIEEMQMKN